MTISALHGFGTTTAMFDYVTRLYEDRPFLTYRGADISYAAMRREVAALAEALSNMGLGRGDGIAILASNTPETLFLRDAAPMRGIFYVALNSLVPPERHADTVRNFGLKAVIVDDREFPGRIEQMRDLLPGCIVQGLGARADGSGLSAFAEPFLDAPFRNLARADDVLRLGQTGGTTGQSKGVVLRHHGQMAYVLMCNATWDLPWDMRFLATTPLSHAAGAFAPLAMLRGGSFRLLPKFSVSGFQDAIRATGSNCTMLVPTQMKRILQDADVDEKIIGGIETISYGAAPISPAVLADWLRRFGPNVSQLYGQAESPMCITSLPKRLHSLDEPHRLSSCGLPNIGVQVAVLRADGSEAETGETGEIVCRSPCVMEGYWGRPDESAAALDGDWLHTGDLGYRDADGFHYIVGRAKEMVISGGFNIYPKEIEDILIEHPSVRDVAVIGVPDEDWGEALKALVVLHDGAALDTGALAALVRSRKGAIQTPKSIEAIDAIPSTPAGKPDKLALRARFWQDRDRGVA